MNIETLKFEASERVLQQEIKSNPQDCMHCRMWQAGGEMSVCMNLCKHCGKKNAFSSIRYVIEDLAKSNNMTYLDAWDIAFTLLHHKQAEYKANGNIYFDEDWFDSDLKKGFKNYLSNTTTEAPKTSQKIVINIDPNDKVTIIKKQSFVKRLVLTIKRFFNGGITLSI